MKNNTKHKITTRKMKPMLHSSPFTLRSSLIIILFSFFILHLIGCKDDCPEKDTHINKGNNRSIKKSHYTLKGKIINGTYNTPINPGMKLELRVNFQGLFDFQTEELGNTTIQPDDSFSITYPHSKLAENYGANMRLEGGNMTIEYLPKNRDVDTILYRSTWGTVVLNLAGITPNNKLYYAYRIGRDSLILDVLNLGLVCFMIQNHWNMTRFTTKFVVNQIIKVLMFRGTHSLTPSVLNIKKLFKLNMKNNTKHQITTRKMKPMLHSSSFTLHSSLIIILFSFFIFHLIGCKDDCPEKDTHINKGNNRSIKKSHYTLKGKIINGTYNTPINPGMKLELRVNFQGLFDFQTEELGNTTIQPDDSFSITYPHSKLAENYGANMRLEGGNMTIEYLPKNRDVDTILYRSTWGTVVLHLVDVEPFDRKLYWAHYYSQDSLISEDQNLVLVFIMTLNPLKLLMVLFEVGQRLLD